MCTLNVNPFTQTSPFCLTRTEENANENENSVIREFLRPTLCKFVQSVVTDHNVWVLNFSQLGPLTLKTTSTCLVINFHLGLLSVVSMDEAANALHIDSLCSM